MEKHAPGRVTVLPRYCRKRFPHDLIRARFGLAREPCQEFQIRQTSEQWSNQWLNRNERSVIGQRVAPGFKEMGIGKMPVGNRSCLIFVIAESNNCLCLALSRLPIQI